MLVVASTHFSIINLYSQGGGGGGGQNHYLNKANNDHSAPTSPAMNTIHMYPVKYHAPPPPTIKNGSCLNVRISVVSNVSSNVVSISETIMVPIHDYEKRYAEAFAITKIARAVNRLASY